MSMRVFNLRFLKRCATSVACSLLAFPVSLRVLAQASSDPLPNFWRTDGIVNAVAIANNTAYIGGDFGYVGPANGAAGLVDTDFGGLVYYTTETAEEFELIEHDAPNDWRDRGTVV